MICSRCDVCVLFCACLCLLCCGAPSVRLQTYINNDLLECAWSAEDEGNSKTHRFKQSKCILRRMLRSSQPRIRESSARLVNAMASESAGRSYMLSNPYVIQWLISLMKHETGDSMTRQNALGALQKFSLRRLPQTIMIEKGVIEFIVEVLRNHVMGTCDWFLHSCGVVVTRCVRSVWFGSVFCSSFLPVFFFFSHLSVSCVGD